MNSYPHEFLYHPQPLMFVAGLTPSSRDRAASRALPGQRDRSSSTTGHLDVSHGAPALTTPITSPERPEHASLPISPPASSTPTKVDSSTSLDQIAGPSTTYGSEEKEDEFEILTRNLREALEGMGGKGKVWLKQRERRDFRIMLVDKRVGLPMRKVNASPSSSQGEPSTPHSPLSPLTPTSPLYPDGLIAPVWVRKHTEMVPSVFVMFLRLYESPDTERETDETRRVKEQEMDDGLVKEIGERRRRLGERGIKLTVVLMASAAALDSPSLDPRLSYLRRASALSAKASLFVLSPVPADQLPEFVESLQEALYDSAVEYYTTHAKRVKRKRARVSTSSFVVPGTAGKVLGGQGWAVRYDWKSGWFAEIRGELEEARRHYEDCWNELARMFSSTQTLPPRSKRWAEAKVLADCVAMRICRLLLYSDEAPKVLGPFFVHLKRFGDLSRGWGIGEETFEFWSWIARQYRIFAELLELGVQSGLRIPTLTPPVFPTAQSAAVPPTPEFWSTPISSTNPLQILQPPAFYFYTAASCSVQRQKRFDEALTLEDSTTLQSAPAGYVSTAPGFANEKKVDHSALIVELFTKAYSLLKEQDLAQNRVALYVAYRIAETYCQSGQHDMAMRFFERISQTFERERWTPIVRQIRKLWYECTQRTGHVDSAARLLVEMMCPDSGIEGEERTALPEDLISLLKTTAPASEEPIVIEMDRENPLLHVTAGFWQAEATILASVPFQMVIACPEIVSIPDLAFSSAVISFLDGRPDFTVEHGYSPSTIIDIGNISHENQAQPSGASLIWKSGERLVFDGTLTGSQEGTCEITAVRLQLKQGPWDVQLVFCPLPLRQWALGETELTPADGLSSSISFITKPIQISLVLDHLPVALQDERIPILVKIANNDDREVHLILSAFLHPGDEGDDANISLDEQETSSLIKDVELGVLAAGQKLEKTIHLKALAVGTRIVDVSVQASLTSATDSSTSTDVIPARIEDFDSTAVIPVMAPFGSSFKISYSTPRLEGEGLSCIATVVTTLSGKQDRPIEVKSIVPTADDLDLRFSSLDLDPMTTQTWTGETSYNIVSKFSIRPDRRSHVGGGVADSRPGIAITWRSSASEEPIDSFIPLPPLIFPPQHSFLTARLQSPQTVHLNRPFPVILHLSNTHPTQPVADISLSVDTSDAFVWMGNRVSRLTDLPAKCEREIQVRCVPIAGAGWFDLPRIRVFEGIEDDKRDIAVMRHEGGTVASTKVFVRP